MDSHPFLKLTCCCTRGFPESLSLQRRRILQHTKREGVHAACLNPTVAAFQTKRYCVKLMPHESHRAFLQIFAKLSTGSLCLGRRVRND